MTEDDRLVSSVDVVVGDPTTAAALSVVADCPSGSRALPATSTLTVVGSGSPSVPVKLNGSVAMRRPSPAPSVGLNWIAIVQVPPPPRTMRPAQLSAPILKSVVFATL